MKTWDQFVSEGISVTNDYGEHLETSKNSIVFPNGRLASICTKEHWPEQESKYSIAVCDYYGYFDWEVLKPFGANKHGTVECDTEEEVCNALTVISLLK